MPLVTAEQIKENFRVKRAAGVDPSKGWMDLTDEDKRKLDEHRFRTQGFHEVEHNSPSNLPPRTSPKASPPIDAQPQGIGAMTRRVILNEVVPTYKVK